MENFKKRQTRGPEKVSAIGQPGKQMTGTHAPHTPEQPGTPQNRGRTHDPHSPPNTRQGIHGGVSAPRLVRKMVGSQKISAVGQARQNVRTVHERQDSESLNPPSHGLRERTQFAGGGEALRPQKDTRNGFGVPRTQPRVMGKLGRLIRHMVGSRKMPDNY